MGLLGPPLNRPPQRIVSLVPSLTETIDYLSEKEIIVGRTRFCIHPSSIKNIAQIGGTKNPNIDRIHNLNPDLIIANKEENRKEDIALLANRYPVWLSEISDYKSMIKDMDEMGRVIQESINAQKLIEAMAAGRSSIKKDKTHRVAYFIWKDPWMTVGADTYIHDTLNACGLINVFSDKMRYPEVSLSELKDRNPDFVLLSSEPFPFKKKHIKEISVNLPSTRTILVDGEMFSWYGSRYLKAIDYFKELTSRMSTL